MRYMYHDNGCYKQYLLSLVEYSRNIHVTQFEPHVVCKSSVATINNNVFYVELC